MQVSDIYRGITKAEVAAGDTVLFWKDKWKNEVFQDRFPSAFSFATDPDMSVRQLLSSDRLSEVFHIPLSHEARQEVTDLQADTMGVSITEDKDSWSCVWGRGVFCSTQYYAYCFSQVQVDDVFKWIWESKCTMQWKVFLWLLLSERLNTRNMLKRRHYRIQNDDYTCLLCCNPPEEDITHLFFTCPFSQRCWDALGIQWPNDPCRLRKLHGAKARWARPMFLKFFVVAAWGIWKERNDKHFHGIQPSFGSWRGRFKWDFAMLVHRAKQEHSPFILSLAGSL